MRSSAVRRIGSDKALIFSTFDAEVVIADLSVIQVHGEIPFLGGIRVCRAD